MRLPILLLLISTLASNVSAQVADSSAALHAGRLNVRDDLRLGASAGTAALMGGGLMFFSLATADQTGRYCHPFCGDQLERALYLGVAGAVVGTVLGAALPKLSSECSAKRRALHSVLGGTLGAATGYAIGYFLLERGWQLTMPLGSMVGSTTAVQRCSSVDARLYSPESTQRTPIVSYHQ